MYWYNQSLAERALLKKNYTQYSKSFLFFFGRKLNQISTQKKGALYNVIHVCTYIYILKVLSSYEKGVHAKQPVDPGSSVGTS